MRQISDLAREETLGQNFSQEQLVSFKAKTWLQTGVFLGFKGECACELNYISPVLGNNTLASVPLAV